jgi:hypothetical protein
VRRLLVTMTLVSVLGAACSSDDAGDASTPTSEAAVTTTEVTAAPSSVPADCPDQPDSRAGSPPPAQGAALTNGMYFGFITALDAEDLKLTFDAAQLLTGDAAARAAAAEGSEESDFWIRNSSTATRTLELADDAVLCTADPANPVENRKVSLVQLNQTLGDGEPLPGWIDVRNGVTIRVQHQFLP